jgi:hypothetical protein
MQFAVVFVWIFCPIARKYTLVLYSNFRSLRLCGNQLPTVNYEKRLVNFGTIELRTLEVEEGGREYAAFALLGKEEPVAAIA